MRTFESNYMLCFLSLRLCMGHPEIPRNLKWLFKFIIMQLITISAPLMLCYSTFTVDLKSGNINRIFSNGLLLSMYNYVNFMYFLLLLWQKPLNGLLMKMKEDYEVATTLQDEERALFEKYAAEGNKMTRLHSYSFMMTGTLYLTKSIVIMVYSALIGEFQLLPAYDMTYPGSLEATKNELSGFIIIWICSAGLDLYVVLLYIGFNSIGPMCMIHASGQLLIIKAKIDKVFNVPEKEYKAHVAQQKLKEISIALEDNYKFINIVIQCLKVHHEALIRIAPVLMPVSLLLVLWNLSRGEVQLDFLFNFLGFVVSVSVPCYYSDMLLQQGLNVREALYASGWEKHMDRKSRNMVLFLILRTSQSIAIKTLFRSLSLNTLADVIKQSYTVLNLLNQAYSY